MNELKHKDITRKIIGAAFEVYKFLGNGFTHGCVLFLKSIHECCAFQEVIYQRALRWELSQPKLSFAKEIEQEIFYKVLSEPSRNQKSYFCGGRKGTNGIKSN